MDQSQVINKEASLDTKKLIDLSKQGIEAEADLKDKDIILFVGPTGCGKSTTANYVLGQNMYQKQIKQVKDLDGRICEIEYEVIDSDGSFQIGHTKQSQTISLQIANLRDNYNLCDCPGFFDNRGAEIEIINATSLNKFIQSCASMRMVVLISYYELVAQRGALFMEIFELVTRILKHPEKDQFEKITFLFTKVEEAKQIKVITKEIASFYDCQMGQESYQQQIMKDFLNAILDQIQQSSNNMIVNPLDGNYLEMQQKIINSQPFINPSEEFSFSVSEKSTQKICLYVEETNNTVIKSQQKGHYAKLMETMLEFKQIKDYIQSDYLISSYNDLQREVVKNFEKQKNLVFKIFQEASEKSNIFCTQNMLEIEQIIKQLQIIDTYKERVFEKDIFKTSESEFKQEVQNVCSEIGQRILEFPQNLENVKNHLQKLKDISEQTQIGSQIYKQSLELINHQYQQGFKSFIHLSEQLYQKPNLLDLDKLKNDIDQIASQIEFFKQIDVFIRDFIQENEKQNIYENMKQTQINNNQNILQNLKNLIEYLKQEFKNQPSFEDSLLLFNPEVKMLPDFEINLLRLLNQNIKYSMNIPNCEKNYDEGLQYLKQFNEQLFNFIKENSKDDFHLYKLQTVLKVLESIRNLDSFIQGKTIEEYRQIMEEIRQKIVKKSGEAKEILDKYSDQIEELEEIEILNEEVQKNNKKMEQKEFKKLKDTIDFLISMQWTDEYFQTKFTFHKQTKINKKLTNYFELCIKKIQDLLQDDNYIWIRFFLIKMKHLSIFSIPNFNEKYEECKNSIKIKVKEQNDIINDFIRDMKQEVKYNNFHWKTINEYILYLKKIQKLDMINEVKQNSNLIIANLSNLIEKYYEQNFQQIELFSKGQQAPDTSYSKYHEFIKQAKIISTDYQEIEQLANGYSFDKLTSQVNKIYQSMVFEYIQKKQSIDDLQDIQGNYDAIKRFVDIMNEFDSIKTEFRNLQTPKEVIQDSFKKLDSLIRNEEYQSLDQEIDLLSKLQSERDKLTLSKFLEKLFDTQYSQIQKISIIFQFKRNDQIDFTSLHNDLTKISQILKIFKKYQQQLFHQSEQQLSQFLKDFNENFIKHQNKLLINQVKNLKFKDMESKYDYLKQLISYLGEFKNLFNQAEWDINIKNEIDKIVKEIEQAIFSLHDQRELKHLNSLYYCLSEAYTSNSEQWQRIYSDELQNTKQAIQQLFKSLEQSINDKMQNQDFTFQSQIKQMKEFNQKGENLDSSLYNECLAIVMRIEEQMTEQNNQKYLDILIHFQKGLVKEVITKLKQMKKTDQPAFKKILNTIQQRIDQSVSFIKTSYPVIEVQNLQNELKVILCSMDIIDKFKNENDVCQINDQIIEGLSQHLFTNSNKLFYEFDKIININQESFTAQNLQSFFKHQQFFQILKEQLDETKELKNSEKLFQDILTKLILCLENVEKSQLLDDKLQINSFQIQTWKKFDCLIVLIQSESNIFENSQQLKKIKEIGLKIKTYDTIFKEIKNKFENNEKQFQQFLEECEFQKVKEMIFVLRKSSYLNKELSYEFVDISQLLKQTEQKVTSLTKEAVDIVKSTLNYDQKTNELINKIYRADDHLKGIEQFPYESQMQIVIQTLNDSLDKEIENIHNFSQENSIKIVKVGQVLITIQKIAEHVSKFVQIVDKKLYEAADQIQQILGEEFVFEIGNTYKEDPSMAQIINKIPQFKLYKTEKFNELVGKHDVNYVLSKILQGNKKQQLSTQEKEDLKQYYNIYLSKYEEIIGLYKYKKEKWSEIVESAKLKSKSINLERIQQEKRTVLQMLAQLQ